jgi:transposase
MATGTMIGRKVATAKRIAKPTVTKSDQARTLYREGKTVTQVADALGIGYAFAYGIAKRGKFNLTAANRRPEPNAKITAVIRWCLPGRTEAEIVMATAAFTTGGDLPAKRTAKTPHATA